VPGNSLNFQFKEMLSSDGNIPTSRTITSSPEENKLGRSGSKILLGVH
jgi:hypothetical protein